VRGTGGAEGGGGPSRDGGLNREICAQESAADILQLFTSRRADFIDLNLVTAFHRIAKRGGRDIASGRTTAAAKEAFEGILSEVRARTSHFDTHHLTNIAWALARLALADEALLDDTYSACSTKMADSGPSDLAFTLWAFASLDSGAEPLFEAISAAAINMLDEFTSPELSTTAWSMARLQRFDVPLFDSIS